MKLGDMIIHDIAISSECRKSIKDPVTEVYIEIRNFLGHELFYSFHVGIDNFLRRGTR